MSGLNQISDPVARQFFEENLERIQQSFGPDHIILFGSRAKGTAREDSDVDIILVSDQFEGTRFPDRMTDFLMTIRPKPDVEAFCYTTAEFNEMRNRIGVIADAARDGIWIH